MLKIYDDVWVRTQNGCSVFPKIGVPQNGWFIMEYRTKMDDLGGFPLFLETPKSVGKAYRKSSRVFLGCSKFPTRLFFEELNLLGMNR